MKLIFTFVALLVSLSAFAQSPKRFSYQAVVRGSLQELVAEKEVPVRVSILKSTSTGEAIYVEDHKPKTDVNGLLTIQIGGGTVLAGSFDKIDWSTGIYFLETRIDPDGRGLTNNPIIGVSQLLSVPYAIYAVYADSVKGHRVGDLYGGGVIFSLWHDRAGQEHGLIASLNDLGTGIWASPVITNATIGASYQDGAANTTAIVAALGGAAANTAAGVCDAYAVGAYTDWYLPAMWELNQLYAQATTINALFDTDNDPLTLSLNLPNYWSSTIAVPSSATSSIENAYSLTFRGLINSSVAPGTANSTFQNTGTLRGIRAIRRF